MRRKDGKAKRKARRTRPVYACGFRNNPATEPHRHALWSGKTTSSHYSAVSLFSGCGGLDLALTGGFAVAGRAFDSLPFDIIYAADNSADAVEAYRLNLGSHIVNRDLAAAPPESLPPANVLIGGFPCQDFSSSGPKVGLAGERGQLYQVLERYMRHHQPAVVVAENVPHLARLRGGAYLETILTAFEDAGYRFQVWDLYAPDYGLAQSRRRLFLVGVRNDLRAEPVKPEPTHTVSYVSIDQCIGDLEGVCDESIPNQSQYFVATRATAGGGQGDHTNRVGDVAYCIRANARGRIQFHYSLPRRLTVRECARLQGFPDQFVFPFTTQRNLTLIGNAVPPVLGYHVAMSVSTFLDSAAAGCDLSSTVAGIAQGAVSKRTRKKQLRLFEPAR